MTDTLLRVSAVESGHKATPTPDTDMWSVRVGFSKSFVHQQASAMLQEPIRIRETGTLFKKGEE